MDSVNNNEINPYSQYFISALLISPVARSWLLHRYTALKKAIKDRFN